MDPKKGLTQEHDAKGGDISRGPGSQQVALFYIYLEKRDEEVELPCRRKWRTVIGETSEVGDEMVTWAVIYPLK